MANETEEAEDNRAADMRWSLVPSGLECTIEVYGRDGTCVARQTVCRSLGEEDELIDLLTFLALLAERPSVAKQVQDLAVAAGLLTTEGRYTE